MEYAFFILMILVLGYVLYRNMNMLNKYKHNRDYIECYRKMLEKDESAYDDICKYIEKETLEEFKSKAYVLKFHEELDRGLDYKNSLDSINMEELFYANGRFSASKLSNNIDAFIWLFMDLAKARQLSKFDVMNELKEKMSNLSGLEDRVEYRLFMAIYNALNEKEDGGIEFLNQLLDGSYYELQYDKGLINMYKRFASATLAYSNEPLEDYYKEDLHEFAATSIGGNFMRDLEIYDKYLPREVIAEQIKEETEEEENKA